MKTRICVLFFAICAMMMSCSNPIPNKSITESLSIEELNKCQKADTNFKTMYTAVSLVMQFLSDSEKADFYDISWKQMADFYNFQLKLEQDEFRNQCSREWNEKHNVTFEEACSFVDSYFTTKEMLPKVASLKLVDVTKTLKPKSSNIDVLHNTILATDFQNGVESIGVSFRKTLDRRVTGGQFTYSMKENKDVQILKPNETFVFDIKNNEPASFVVLSDVELNMLFKDFKRGKADFFDDKLYISSAIINGVTHNLLDYPELMSLKDKELKLFMEHSDCKEFNDFIRNKFDEEYLSEKEYYKKKYNEESERKDEKCYKFVSFIDS